MKVVNLLDFLNNTKDLYTLDYTSCKSELVNFLDLMTEDEQFTQKIDLGIIYLEPRTMDQFLIVDGLSRLLSLSLLLHAICECYKKTSEKNEKAIKTIRSKYLLSAEKTKLHLPDDAQKVYNKIIFGERLSGKEKNSPMFKLLHSFWSQIKSEDLQASKIFKMLKKIFVIVAETSKAPARDLYYNLNKDKRELNSLLLIEDYLKDFNVEEQWLSIKNIFKNDKDIVLFFKDFFITKFNFKSFFDARFYEYFVNYFETMLQYMSEEVLMEKMKRSAILYHNIINVNFNNEDLKRLLIQIKMHNGEDTYAYILNIYNDYIDGNISEVTFLEILSTIDEYLRNRLKAPNNVSFNELISYLNAFITCK